jgi:hypothetical protein
MAIYMSGLGVPQQVIDLQPTASPNSMNYVDYAQAKAWGLLSPQVAAADPAPKEPKKAPMFTCLATLCNGVPTSALELAASPQRLTVPQYAVIRRWEAAKPMRVK